MYMPLPVIVSALLQVEKNSNELIIPEMFIQKHNLYLCYKIRIDRCGRSNRCGRGKSIPGPKKQHILGWYANKPSGTTKSNLHSKRVQKNSIHSSVIKKILLVPKVAPCIELFRSCNICYREEERVRWEKKRNLSNSPIYCSLCN